MEIESHVILYNFIVKSYCTKKELFGTIYVNGF